MTKKLAVLISGSYRNFDEVWKVNLPIIESLGIPYEVILHTWRENPELRGNFLETEFKNSFYFSIFPKKYQPFTNDISEDEIYSKYNFNKVMVDDFPESFLATKFNLADPTKNTRYQLLLNSTAMYFGIEKCKVELVKNPSFTHFLRVRTDFLLDARHTNAILEHDLCFFGQLLPTAEGPIGDQCFGGSIDKALPILDLFETVQEITQDSSWDVTKPMVLAEDVIRRRLKPFRNQWNIQYFEGRGEIKRPNLMRLKFDIKVFRAVCMHNAMRLKTICHLVLKKGTSHGD